jgi:hypothetical protein
MWTNYHNFGYAIMLAVIADIAVIIGILQVQRGPYSVYSS